MSPRYHDPIDINAPVFSLTDSDHINLADFFEGTLITGSPGSGKTSCSGYQFANVFLGNPTMGGLVLTAKAEETRNWIRYAREAGREKDLIVFNAESGLCFDPLHYEWSRPGRGAGDLENVIDIFTTLAAVGRHEVGHGHDPFGSVETSS